LIGADAEGDGERIGAVGAAEGLHVDHALDAVDLPLDGARRADHWGTRAGVASSDLNGGGTTSGYCATGKASRATPPTIIRIAARWRERAAQ
jgi:hypothetical protein